MPECPLNITVFGANNKPIMTNMVSHSVEALKPGHAQPALHRSQLMNSQFVPIKPKPVHANTIAGISGTHQQSMFNDPSMMQSGERFAQPFTFTYGNVNYSGSSHHISDNQQVQSQPTNQPMNMTYTQMLNSHDEIPNQHQAQQNIQQQQQQQHLFHQYPHSVEANPMSHQQQYTYRHAIQQNPISMQSADGYLNARQQYQDTSIPNIGDNSQVSSIHSYQQIQQQMVNTNQQQMVNTNQQQIVNTNQQKIMNCNQEIQSNLIANTDRQQVNQMKQIQGKMLSEQHRQQISSSKQIQQNVVGNTPSHPMNASQIMLRLKMQAESAGYANATYTYQVPSNYVNQSQQYSNADGTCTEYGNVYSGGVPTIQQGVLITMPKQNAGNIQYSNASTAQSYDNVNTSSAFTPVAARPKSRQRSRKKTDQGTKGKRGGSNNKCAQPSSTLSKAPDAEEDEGPKYKPEDMLNRTADTEVETINVVDDDDSDKIVSYKNDSDEALDEANKRLESVLSTPSPLVLVNDASKGSFLSPQPDILDNVSAMMDENPNDDPDYYMQDLLHGNKGDNLAHKKFNEPNENGEIVERNSTKGQQNTITGAQAPYTVVTEDTRIKVPITRSDKKSDASKVKSQQRQSNSSPGLSSNFGDMSISKSLHSRRGDHRKFQVDTAYANAMTPVYEANYIHEEMQNPLNQVMWPVNYSQEFVYPKKKERTCNTLLLATHLTLKQLEKSLCNGHSSTGGVQSSSDEESDHADKAPSADRDIASDQKTSDTDNVDKLDSGNDAKEKDHGMKEYDFDVARLQLFPHLSPQEMIPNDSNEKYVNETVKKWPQWDHQYCKSTVEEKLNSMNTRLCTGNCDHFHIAISFLFFKGKSQNQRNPNS